MTRQIVFNVLLLVFCLAGLVFADATIGIINGLIQLKINIVGFFLEPLLQWIFGMPLRQAQIVSVWLYLLIASFVCWQLLRIGYQTAIGIMQALCTAWIVKSRGQKMKFMLLMLVLSSVLIKLMLIFV